VGEVAMSAASGPLAGRVAVVTGASSGLGRATATALARSGASVALLARHEGDLRALAEELNRDGRSALAMPADLADAGSIEQAMTRVAAALGPVGVLVNAAATDAPGPVGELSVEDWDWVQAVNLRAVFLLCKLVVPQMTAAGQGTIVNVSSVAGRRGWAEASAYCASKFALTGFTQALAAEVRSHGVRACVVYPGAMATHWGTFASDERDQGDGIDGRPEDRLPPDTVASYIAWLVTAPPELIVNESTVTPLNEQGWP
jgi:NAD(P)-dependent dehydrogenase (short-subunit alcohol dehydrogenase family)